MTERAKKKRKKDPLMKCPYCKSVIFRADYCPSCGKYLGGKDG